MYLSRLIIVQSRIALSWLGNPYRVHQRLCKGVEKDPRFLFRIEELNGRTQILVQSHQKPDWLEAFRDLNVLLEEPQWKVYNPSFVMNQTLRFRLLANPTVKRNGKRLGLFNTDEQRAWLVRKMKYAGTQLITFQTNPRGMSYSHKNTPKDSGCQTHYGVLFDGFLCVRNPLEFRAALESGIGSAKGYGFGLFSIAAQ